MVDGQVHFVRLWAKLMTRRRGSSSQTAVGKVHFVQHLRCGCCCWLRLVPKATQPRWRGALCATLANREPTVVAEKQATADNQPRG